MYAWQISHVRRLILNPKCCNWIFDQKLPDLLKSQPREPQIARQGEQHTGIFSFSYHQAMLYT